MDLNNNNDCYDTLGIEKNATIEEITKAYKLGVKKYHPDRNNSPDAANEFRKIQTAYEILSNSYTKKKYDEFENLSDDEFIKYIYEKYIEMVIDTVEMFNLDNDDKQILISLFKVEDYQEEIKNSDYEAIINKFSTNIAYYAPKIAIKKINTNYPLISPIINYIAGFWGYSDYIYDPKN